jgi:hypothetical protein
MKRLLPIVLCLFLASCGSLSKFLPQGTIEVSASVLCGGVAATILPEPTVITAAAAACGGTAIVLTPDTSLQGVDNKYQASVQKARDWQEFLLYGGIVASLLFFIVIPLLQRRFNLKEVEKARMESRVEDIQMINALQDRIAKMKE